MPKGDYNSDYYGVKPTVIKKADGTTVLHYDYSNGGTTYMRDSKGNLASVDNGSVNQYLNKGYTIDPRSYTAQTQVLGDYLNNIYDKQKQMLLAEFRAARDKALGQFNEQKTALQPMYQQMRDQTDVMNAQAVNKLREIMAANGLASGDRALGGSGDNLSAQVALNTQRQNNINSLNLQQQQATNTIDNQIADLMNPMREQSITSQIELERAKALLEDMYRQQEYNFRQSQFDWQKLMDQAGLTGVFNGTPTLAAQNMLFNQNMARNQFDWQKILDEANLTGNFRGTPTLQAQQFAYQQQQDALAQQNWEREFQYRALRDQIADQRYKAEFDEDVRRFGLNYALEKARLNNQITQQNIDNAIAKARLSLDQQQFEWQKQKSNTTSTDPYNQAMVKAVQLAQSDPRLKPDIYGNPPSQDVVNKVINEYYNLIKNQSSYQGSSSWLSGLLGGLGSIANRLSPAYTDDQLRKYLK